MFLEKKSCSRYYPQLYDDVLTMTGGICSELPGIANGGVTVLGGTQQELRFHCDPGFLLLGSSDLKCMPDNTYVMIIISLVPHSALKSEK